MRSGSSSRWQQQQEKHGAQQHNNSKTVAVHPEVAQGTRMK
jgi:hypothetical protein